MVWLIIEFVNEVNVTAFRMFQLAILVATNFMFAKYTKSRVYTCHVKNWISYLGTRGEP